MFFVVVPHITNAIQEWVERVSKVPVDGLDGEPDVCIVEVTSYCWQTVNFEICCYNGICPV